MLKLFSIFFIFLPTLSFGTQFYSLPKAQDRLKIDYEDIIITKDQSKIKYDVLIDPESIEWVRYENILPIPKARIKIKFYHKNQNLVIKYNNDVFIPQVSNKISFTEIPISLFSQNKILVFEGEKLVSETRINIKKPDQNKIYLDYSCSRNNIEIDGLKNDYLSIGCRTKRVGQFGNEKPLLEIIFISPNIKLNQQTDIYHGVFMNNTPIKFKVSQDRFITIKSKVPKRLHRLFTAYGFGPYALETKLRRTGEKTQKINDPVSTALFFYLNYKISKTSSVRGFNATVFNKSIFSNSGVYLGNDFGYSFDNRLYFTTLLGVQTLYFKYDENNEPSSKSLFPQGIEFMYRHAFDIPNYIISGGIFLSTNKEIDYKNIWIRWGKNYFWELNYIGWGENEFEANTWGLSVGLPFKGFL